VNEGCTIHFEKKKKKEKEKIDHYFRSHFHEKGDRKKSILRFS